ncbi:MAG: hypothetical protein WD273_13095 [Trueperaceae bacterium]
MREKATSPLPTRAILVDAALDEDGAVFRYELYCRAIITVPPQPN